MKRKIYILIAAIILVQLIFLIIFKFTAWPEMTLWPYLITKGWLPYRDIAIAHTPLMLFDLAIFYKLFGVGIAQLKIFTWIIILLTDLLIFITAKKLWKEKIALGSLFAYTFLLLFYDGNGLWFDLYMGVLALCTYYFLKQKNWILVGISWLLALLSKQTAIWFLIPIVYSLLSDKKKILSRTKQFIIGAASVSFIFIILLLIFRVLPDFWNWAVKFGIFILPRAQGQVQFPGIKALLVAGFPFLILLPLLFKTKTKYIDLVLFIFAGVLGAFPRFEFFHFQPALPFLAIAAALTFSKFKTNKKYIKAFFGFYLLTSLYMFASYTLRNWNEGVRFYESNVQDVIDYVKYNTQLGDRIFVLNWWDNIYALTDTVPSTDPWIPQLSWYTEIPSIQDKMVEGLRLNPPRLIIFNPYSGIGLSSYIPQKVYEFVTENYKLSQRVDNLEILIPNK